MSAAETTTNTGLPIRRPNDARGATHAIDPLSDGRDFRRIAARRVTSFERLTREWVDAETAGCVRDGAQVNVSRVRHHAMAVSKDAKTEHYD
jgi:hypothetical protein